MRSVTRRAAKGWHSVLGILGTIPEQPHHSALTVNLLAAALGAATAARGRYYVCSPACEFVENPNHAQSHHIGLFALEAQSK